MQTGTPAAVAPQPDGAIPVVKGVHRYIPLDKVFASKTNPRTQFNKEKMAEMVESIRAHGILEPIMVRPAPGQPVASGHMEIIFGERRWRAAKMIQAAEIPCIVKAMTDEEVCEVQVIENVQRDDLHPLEEARGYNELAHTFKHTIGDIAGKVGKSTQYVRNRMKLLDLEKTVQATFLAGKISPSVALLVARIPVKNLQPKAAKECIEWHGGMNASSARQHIERNYMTDLAGAAFDTSDAALVPEAGACSTCPKRTGNEPELFEDIKDGDICTDQVCFRNKSETHSQKIIVAAKKAGQTVLTGAAAKKVMPYQHASQLSDGFVALTEKPYQDPKKRTVKQLLGPDTSITVIVDPYNPGRVIQAVKDSQVKTALKNAGIKLAGPSAVKAHPAVAAREREEKTKAIIKRRVFDTLSTLPVIDTLDEWRMITRLMLGRAHYESRKNLGMLWCPDENSKPRTEGDRWKELEARIPRMEFVDLRRLQRDMVLAEQLGTYGEGKELFESAVRHGVDIGAIRTLVRTERTPKKAKAKKTVKPKADPVGKGAPKLKPKGKRPGGNGKPSAKPASKTKRGSR